MGETSVFAKAAPIDRALLWELRGRTLAGRQQFDEAGRLRGAAEDYLRERVRGDPKDGLNASELVDLLVDRSLEVDSETAVTLLDEALALMPRVDSVYRRRFGTKRAFHYWRCNRSTNRPKMDLVVPLIMRKMRCYGVHATNEWEVEAKNASVMSDLSP